MASNTSPWLALGLCLAAGFASAMPPPGGAPPLLSARDQVAEANAILDERLETLLPALMAETGFDAWLVLNREYAEDPVYFTLVPQPTHAARRTTLLAFFLRPDGGVDRFVVNRYPLGGPYESAWAGGDLDAQQRVRFGRVARPQQDRFGRRLSTRDTVRETAPHLRSKGCGHEPKAKQAAPQQRAAIEHGKADRLGRHAGGHLDRFHPGGRDARQAFLHSGPGHRGSRAPG